MNKKKDLIIVGVLLAGALLLHALSALLPDPSLKNKTADATLAPDAIEYIDPTVAPTDRPSEAPTAEVAAEVTVQPTKAPQEAAAVGPMPRPQTEAVRGYVVLTVGGRQYGDPIAMDRDKIITLKQEDGKINKVHITPEKVFMESSTCDNQDCVQQGEITLDNYKTRVLSTYVICLPNNVSIEFIPAEE